MKQTMWLFTIVLDGMPFLAQHLPEFEKIEGDWRWIIVEGRASKSHCTGWVAGGEPRVSNDGSHEYLKSISTHPRVKVISRPLWEGKIAMVREAMKQMDKAGYLHELDADELWTAEQLEKIADLYDTNFRIGRMEFYCDYFVGPNLVLRGDGLYGNKHNEWRRSWRFWPGDFPISHEPPEMHQRKVGRVLNKKETKVHGLVFRHMSYVDPEATRKKMDYYGYRGGYQSWLALQSHTQFPCRLDQFFYWADGAEVHKI